MPFCYRVDELLRSSILLEALLDFGVRRACTLKITLVHHHKVSEIEHHDLLQLQSTAIVGVHHEHGKIDNSIFSNMHRFLAIADRLHHHIVETGAREQREALVRRGRKAAGLSTGSHAPHKYAVTLRI